MIQIISFYAAGAVSLLACLAHIFIGTAANAKPVLSNLSIADGPRTTMTFSWESNSILMLFMAAGFVYGALKQEMSLIYFVTGMALALTVWGAVVAVRLSHNPFSFPPAILFLIIALFGMVGLITNQ